jgi:hypothetical protein
MKHNNIREHEFVKSLGIKQGSIETGWTRSLEENLVQLQAEIEGLQERLAIGVSAGVPAAYAAQRVFTPESGTVEVDTGGGVPVAMNYIVRDGITYDIPIVLPGPGAFVAKYLVLAIYLKYFDEELGKYVETNVSGNQPYFLNSNFRALYTTKFSNRSAAFSNPPLGLPDAQTYPALNYFWNLLDSKSGVKLADELMSQHVLLQRSRPHRPSLYEEYADGGYFEFDVPFVFERDGQANFLFRPITPFLQTADTQNPQSVTVQVELHGFRYATDQDAMQMGALSR